MNYNFNVKIINNKTVSATLSNGVTLTATKEAYSEYGENTAFVYIEAKDLKPGSACKNGHDQLLAALV